MRLSRTKGFLIAALLLAVAVPATVIFHDALFCKPPPDAELGRHMFYSEGGDEIYFTAEGTANCILNADGSYPHWSQTTYLRFPNRDSFFTGPKTRFMHGTDFNGPSVQSGHIDVDRQSGTATVVLQFNEADRFKSPVNGTYSLKDAQIRY